MKNNIFGYLFFIFIIGIMSFAIYKSTSNNQAQETNNVETAKSVVTTEKGTDLTLGISQFDTINPIITKNKKVQDITKIIYEPLIEITEEGKLEGCLAKEWETTDNTTYIIRLKSGIKWTDGSYFSSSDVKYTIDRLKESSDSVYSENVSKVKEVDIIDNTTIRIILSEEVKFYEYYLNFPILSKNYYGDDDFWHTDKNEAPITTGRFEITDVAGSTITLKKNNNWWNIENNDSVIDTITINLYSSVAELYNAFKLGSIDLIATNNGSYQDYIGTIGYNVTPIEGRNFVFLALNTQSKVLKNNNVRKAVRSAINKEEIASKIYNGNYEMARFPISENSYLLNYSNDNTFNNDDVANKLKDAGWSLKNGRWQKIVNYKTTYLQLNLVVKNHSQRVDVANYIKETFAGQGIEVNIIGASDSEYQKYLENKNYDLILCESTQSIAPDLSTYFGENNLANFSNSEAQEIIKYLDNITEEGELKSKFQRLYEINEDEVAYIGIARNKIYVITNSYLSAEIGAKWYNLFFKFKDWFTS